MRSLFVLAALLVALPAGAVTMEWVPIGDAGNAPDTAINCFEASCGSVDHDYYISRYEVTNAQYAEFLNAKAVSDPLGLYDANMDSDGASGGITQSGSPGTYVYAAKAGFENKPVNYVSFYDALRFANWLENGQAGGDTETGAYTLLGGTPEPSNGSTITRNPGAITFLPSENEWYKAAYYDASTLSYNPYPFADGFGGAACDAAPGMTSHSANCDSAVGGLADVGNYPFSPSEYGTFDQGGNVWEWNEVIVAGSGRGLRGGSFLGVPSALSAPARQGSPPTVEVNNVGFRVARLVPEPAHALLVLAGALVLAAARRRRRA